MSAPGGPLDLRAYDAQLADELSGDWQDCQVRALLAALRETRAALKPFADCADSLPFEAELQNDKLDGSDLTVGDYKRAAAVLASVTDGPEAPHA